MRDLEPLFDDPSVSEIMINAGSVWVERHGQLSRTNIHMSPSEVAVLVERAIGPIGRRVDRSSPFADGRLADGSRVHIAVPPAAIDGVHVTIRRFAPHDIPLDEFGPPLTIEILTEAVRTRRNIVVAGATSTGKTTLLNALAHLVPTGERIVTIEDAAELRVRSPHVVRLESRAPNAEGIGELSLRDLVRNALRMRPDRLIVGEVRGAEALDMVQAMNTGHDGSMSTCHANGLVDALYRLEAMVLMAASGLSLSAVRRQIASAIDLIVHVVRRADGRRAVLEIAAVRCAGDEWAIDCVVAAGPRTLSAA